MIITGWADRRSWSLLWLLMPWLLVSPGHQKPWYWLCRITGSLFSMRGYFTSYCWKIIENAKIFLCFLKQIGQSGLCCQKQVSQAGVINCIPQYSVRCNYLSLTEIPASGNKVLKYSLYGRLQSGEYMELHCGYEMESTRLFISKMEFLSGNKIIPVVEFFSWD